MLEPRIPEDEELRLDALCRLEILDTESEERFDRITRLAKQFFDVPIALVSLVDSDRQWFKSKQGLDAPETPRRISFCGHAILSTDILYVPNTLDDPRFADNPLVTEGLKIRFYAGAPLSMGDGRRIGTLCVIDDKPRAFSKEQLGALRDLADAVQAELERTELLETAKYAARLALVVEHTDNAVIITDANGIIEWVNPGFEQIAGYTLGEVIGEKPGELLQGPDTNPETVALIRERIAAGKSVSTEILNYHRDGTSYWLSLSIQPIRDDSGKIDRFIAIESDITERKKADDISRRLRTTLDLTEESIYTFKPDTLNFIYANRSGQEQVGYRFEELQQLTPCDLLPDYDEQEFRKIVEPLLRGEQESITFETVHRHRDGTLIPVEAFFQYLAPTGEPHRIVNIMRDITERKRLDQMKTEFISTVSHELRTPLTSIRGALGLVVGRYAGDLPEKARYLLEVAERNSERLTLLINDILDLEKIQSGRMQFEFKHLNLADLIQNAIEANEGYAHQHDVGLVSLIEPENAFVSADDHRLMQVLANLISNAVKFSPKGAAVEIKLLRRSEGYRISVRDYGPGIPEEFRERMFQRFAQADSSDTREKGGTGLGLSITKAIVERHGGQIGYDSPEGGGTEFFVELKSLHSSDGELSVSQPSASVLICEDNEDVASILSLMLEQEGLVCDIAGTAESARALLELNTYNVLLLDLNLPDADGLCLLQELRDQPSTRDLPIIVVSGRAAEGKSDTSATLQVVDWLQKPIDRERLNRAVGQALSLQTKPRVLHIEDDVDLVQIVKQLLEDSADLYNVGSRAEAKQLLESEHFDLAILDLTLEDGPGVDLLEDLSGHCPVVIFSGQQVGHEITERVSAALVKSKTTNEDLVSTVKRVLLQVRR